MSSADGPWICAFHQVAALDSPFVLGYGYLILGSLGWAWGSVCIVFFGFLSFYCNICLASVSLSSLPHSRQSYDSTIAHRLPASVTALRRGQHSGYRLPSWCMAPHACTELHCLALHHTGLTDGEFATLFAVFALDPHPTPARMNLLRHKTEVTAARGPARGHACMCRVSRRVLTALPTLVVIECVVRAAPRARRQAQHPVP